MNQSYPNAAEGLKMLFWAQILAIANLVFVVLGAVIAVMSQPSDGLMLVVLVGAVVVVGCYVLQIMGLSRAARDDEGYRSAMTMAIAALVVNLLNGFLLSSVAVIGSLMTMVLGVLAFLQVNIVCQTTGNLLHSMGNDALADRGATVAKIYLVCTAVDIVCTVVGLIPVLDILAGLVSGLSAIVGLVGYILYLTYLNSGSKALL